jgi:hypothetical protein
VGHAAWFMSRGCFCHSGCATNRIFEDVPRNVPTLWVALSWMDTFSGRGKHSQCVDVSPSKICISQKEVVPLREINKKAVDAWNTKHSPVEYPILSS